MTNYTLIYQHNRLEFHCPQLGKQPFYLEFPHTRYHAKNSLLKQELLAKAVGIKKNKRPSVCDLSAGFGQDAYLLYCLGCKLNLVERSFIIADLLKDGLSRAGCDWEIYTGEALDYLESLQQTKNFPEVIYFDPIFPEQHKTARSQKSAEILRLLAGESKDAKAVFQKALCCAKERVVIKRPLHGEPIVDAPLPDIIFKGKTIRFDVYLIKK